MSVYKNDNPDFLQVALDSMLVNQSRVPNEIFMVIDGPVPETINRVIDDYISSYKRVFTIHRLKENKGLGNALRIGVEKAKYDIIARMDSDDICLQYRFEKQLEYITQHPDVDIVGGQCTEFIGTPDNIVSRGSVPLNNEDIYTYMKTRCGMSHVTVMFKRESILRAGNYQDWFWNEDYYLWIRMMLMKSKFANVPDVYVNVRTGDDQYSRRGGMKYFKSEAGLQRFMYKNNVIPFYLYLSNVIKRFVIQIIIPDNIRGWVFRNIIRKIE